MICLLVRIVAAESAERDVRVNCLSPGEMADTHLFGPDKMPEYIKAHAPWSEPTVIVPAALWIACEDSDCVTGQRLAGTEFGQTQDVRTILHDV